MNLFTQRTNNGTLDPCLNVQAKMSHRSRLVLSNKRQVYPSAERTLPPSLSAGLAERRVVPLGPPLYQPQSAVRSPRRLRTRDGERKPLSNRFPKRSVNPQFCYYPPSPKGLKPSDWGMDLTVCIAAMCNNMDGTDAIVIACDHMLSMESFSADN